MMCFDKTAGTMLCVTWCPPAGLRPQAPEMPLHPRRSWNPISRTGYSRLPIPMSRGWCRRQHIEPRASTRSCGAGRLYLIALRPIALAVENNLDVELERYIFPVLTRICCVPRRERPIQGISTTVYSGFHLTGVTSLQYQRGVGCKQLHGPLGAKLELRSDSVKHP